ncbi:MAG: AAA family ATPase [Sulfolobus sp.]|nr:AAA family ATPase [Sulfolobus sp.]
MICEVVVSSFKPRDGDVIYADIANIRFAYPPGCIFSSQYTQFIHADQPLPKVSRLRFKRENGEEVKDDNYVVIDMGDDFLVLPIEVWNKLKELIATYLSEGTMHGGILLYGVPGTGKSYIATKLLSRILGLKVVVKQPTDFMTKYVGEPYQLLNEFINKYLFSDKPYIIVFDEGERFLLKRGGGGEAEKLVEDNMKNILLEKLQEFADSSRPTILVVTTNASINDMDDAMLRRFPWKLYLPPPSQMVYEYIARRETTQRVFKIEDKEYDVQRLAFYASATGISVAEFRTIIKTGSISFLRAKSNFPRRLMPFELQDRENILDITKLPQLRRFDVKNKNVKMLCEGALYTMTAVVASYFITIENRPVYLIDLQESTSLRYGSDDIITLLKQENKPVGIIHMHSNLNISKQLLIERLLEEDNVSFVVITSFESSLLQVQTLKLLPRVDITQLPASDKDSLKKIIYTVNTFYGLKLDLEKTMNELYKEMDFRKAMDILEKMIVMAI